MVYITKYIIGCLEFQPLFLDVASMIFGHKQSGNEHMDVIFCCNITKKYKIKNLRSFLLNFYDGCGILISTILLV